MANKKLTFKDYVTGAIGISKVKLGIDHASPELQKKRMDICNKCPFLKYKNKKPYCSKCTCSLIVKTKAKDAKCPINKW